MQQAEERKKFEDVKKLDKKMKEADVALFAVSSRGRKKFEDVKKLDKRMKETDVPLFAEWLTLTDGKDGKETLEDITTPVTTPITKNDALIVTPPQDFRLLLIDKAKDK